MCAYLKSVYACLRVCMEVNFYDLVSDKQLTDYISWVALIEIYKNENVALVDAILA